MSFDKEYAIRLFFNEIIRTSHLPTMLEEAITGGGYPLSGLVDSLLNVRHENLVERMVNDNIGESHEFRLNEAGLKMYWRLIREDGVLRIRIGGDQVTNYPRFVAAVRRLIEHNTYLR